MTTKTARPLVIMRCPNCELLSKEEPVRKNTAIGCFKCGTIMELVENPTPDMVSRAR